MTEAHLEARLRDRVRQLGGVAIKLAPTQRGLPDRLVLLPGGRMHLLELKTTLGRLSPVQQSWHERVAGLGIRVEVLIGASGIDEWAAARGCDDDGEHDQHDAEYQRERSLS